MKTPNGQKRSRRKYYSNAVSKNYQVNLKAFQQVLSSAKSNGAPGPYNITAYAIKKLPSTHTFLVDDFVDTFENAKPLPDWLVKGKTILLPKNQITEAAKNYRPIACLNTIYKLYSSLLITFLEDHCTINNITVEQAGGRKHSWGCIDQLLINKMVLVQVKKQ